MSSVAEADELLRGRETWFGGLLAEPPARLVDVLQAIQAELGYLPAPVLDRLAAGWDIPLSRIYGVASFYNSFFLSPRGRNVLKVCTGTACHVGGGRRIVEALERHLGVPSGGTTDDLAFTLESAACLGCCSLAPVLAVGDDTHGRLDTTSACAVVDRLRAEELE